MNTQKSFAPDYPHDPLIETVVLVVDETLHLQRVQTKGLDGWYLSCTELQKRRVHPNYPLLIDADSPETGTALSAFSLGSGFFVAPDVIATAAHVLLESSRFKSTDIRKVRFIRYFHNPLRMHEGKIFIPFEDVFKPRTDSLNPAHFAFSSTGEDRALVAVERTDGQPANQAHFIELSHRTMQEGDEVSWVGHPLGLPAERTPESEKIQVIRSEREYVFEIENVSFAGLSGSPIVHEGQAVGILVRGMGSFTLEAGRVRLTEPFLDNFEGAEVQRTFHLHEQVEALRGAHAMA